MPKNLVNAVLNSKPGREFCQLRPTCPDKPLIKHHVTLCKSCSCYFSLQLLFLEILKSSSIFQRNDDLNSCCSNALRTRPALQSALVPTSTRQAVHATPYLDVSTAWVHVKHLADPMPRQTPRAARTVPARHAPGLRAWGCRGLAAGRSNWPRMWMNTLASCHTVSSPPSWQTAPPGRSTAPPLTIAEHHRQARYLTPS
jgi:hypothetical protein